MGCTASKLDNEDVVRRCKERRRLMKEAVQYRHHLASAHADYLRSLLSAASSLTRFAAGAGTLPVSNQTPPVVLLPPPPPLSSRFSPSPPPPSIATKYHYSSHPPTPSVAVSRSSASKNHQHLGRNNYAATPSQASSSVWDWENFYPPSPPDSDYFDRIKQERERKDQDFRHQIRNNNNNSTSSIHHYDHHHLKEDDEEEEDQGREEVHCGEWGEHYGTTTSSSTGNEDEDEVREKGEEEEEEEIRSRSDFGGGSTFVPPPPSEFGSRSSSLRKPATSTRARSEAESSSSAGDMRMVVRHGDLAEIAAALEEYFVKAAAAGEGMSEFLETGRDQLDRSFRQLKSKLS